MTETTPGREPVQIVEIRQPFCERVYGVAPCTASGPASGKCYNTRSTCQDAANYSAPTPLSLFFSRGRVGEQTVSGATYIVPSLVSVSTSPTKINLAGANPDAQGIGNRALCSLVFQDHNHTDRVVDPYVEGRGTTPLTLGTYWTKWMARNRYRQNIEIVIFEGYVGQTLAEMSNRKYFFDSIQGPDDSGRITIQGKDILARLEERKAQAPLASPGVLFAAITDVATSFTVANALITDYPATGTVRIDSEIITYSAVVVDGDNLVFTVTARGTDNSTAAAHSVDVQVQLCLRITNSRIDDLIALFMNTYGGIDNAYLNLAGWATEISTYMSFWRLSRLITIPTAVVDLISEVLSQTLVNCWWNEKTALVELKAVRGVDTEPPLITAESHILAGSFRLSENPKERITQAWVYYNQRDKTLAVTQETNYGSASIIADLVEEELYGEAAVRKIFGTFLTSAALANTTASKLLLRYGQTPATVQFRLDAKDRTIWTGSVVKISHPLDVDEFGARRIRQWLVTSAQEIEPGETIECVAEDTTLYGRIYYIMADGAADYPGADAAPFKNAYIGNAAGLLSDGSTAARIA